MFVIFDDNRQRAVAGRRFSGSLLCGLDSQLRISAGSDHAHIGGVHDNDGKEQGEHLIKKLRG